MPIQCAEGQTPTPAKLAASHCSLPAEMPNFPASWCLASLISSNSLSRASGVSLWPAARRRNTFASSKRISRISTRDGSLVDHYVVHEGLDIENGDSQHLCGVLRPRLAAELGKGDDIAKR